MLVPIRGWRRSLRIVTSPASLLVIWCALSLAWTQHLDLTAKRLMLLGLVYGGIFGSVSDLDARSSLGNVRIVLMAVLALNFAAAIAVQNVGTQTFSSDRPWRGIMAHKNIAGMLCAITVIVLAFEGEKVSLAATAAAVGVTLVFFFLAWSKTTLASLPIALAAGGAIVMAARRYPPSLAGAGPRR